VRARVGTGRRGRAAAAPGERVRQHPLAADYLTRRCGTPPPGAVLAARWRASPASVSRWLRGRSAMPRAAADDLAALAGVPTTDLLEPPADVGGGAAGVREPQLVTLTPILLECVRADLDHALGRRSG